MRLHPTRSPAALVLLGAVGLCSLALPGCNLKQVAMRNLADTVAEPGSVYASDEDPELVRESLPVMLKIMEQLADGLPRHVGIRLALARAFTSYSVGFLGSDADRLNERSVEQAREAYGRARRMSLRAYRYGLRGLEIALPGAGEAFAFGRPRDRAAEARVLGAATRAHVPLLYWTAAALGSAISMGKDDMQLVGELPKVEALMIRALELDEAFDEGAIHDFFITYDGGRSEAQGGGAKRARAHLERALALSKNKRVGPLVSYAEAVTVDAQDKKEFTRLLERALAYDVDSDPDHRLVNLLAQRRARWLLSRSADLFAE